MNRRTKEYTFFSGTESTKRPYSPEDYGFSYETKLSRDVSPVPPESTERGSSPVKTAVAYSYSPADLMAAPPKKKPAQRELYPGDGAEVAEKKPSLQSKPQPLVARKPGSVGSGIAGHKRSLSTSSESSESSVDSMNQYSKETIDGNTPERVAPSPGREPKVYTHIETRRRLMKPDGTVEEIMQRSGAEGPRSQSTKPVIVGEIPFNKVYFMIFLPLNYFKTVFPPPPTSMKIP